MSVADELNRCSATEQARLIRAKTISPVELLRAHLETIERLNPKINAICTLAADSAMADAKRAERAVIAGKEIGLLHGLPIGIKDVTPTAGIRTTFGSPLHVDHVPTEDAAVVARIKQAGAIVIGKTNTPEFAAGANTVNRLFGATRNPWNLDLSVGGSTGGGGQHWRRGWWRSPRERISAAHCGCRPRFVAWSGCGLPADSFLGFPRHCHGIWAPSTDRWRAPPKMRPCCLKR